MYRAVLYKYVNMDVNPWPLGPGILNRGGGREQALEYSLVPVLICENKDNNRNVQGTGTRDLIWLKVVSLDRSWLVGLTDNH